MKPPKPSVRVSRPYRRPDSTTHFINVDLDIHSRWDLQPIVSALGPNVFVLHVGRAKRTYHAHVELPAFRGTADTGIRRFCALIAKLPAPERLLWNKARTRDFNIGVQAAMRPLSFRLKLPPETLRAVSEIGAGIVLTLYSPDVRTIEVRNH